MKKVLKTVAMILIVVIVSNSFTGCIIIGKGSYDDFGKMKKLAIGIDVFILAVVIFEIILAVISIKGINSPEKSGTQDIVLSDQIEQSMETFNETLKTLPKAQVDTLTEKVQALPETEKIIFMETFYMMQKEKKDDIMDKINALSEKELYNTVEYINSLSEIQFNTLLLNIENNVIYENAQ